MATNSTATDATATNATKYTDIKDTEYLDFDQQAKKLRAAIAEKEKIYESLKSDFAAWQAAGTSQYDDSSYSSTWTYGYNLDLWNKKLTALDKELIDLSGKAEILETSRDNRGAMVTQMGVNTQAWSEAEKAVKNENLLSQNINQEITGRVARNNQQANEALSNVNMLNEATRGRQAAKAGQAGYDMASGTAGALADASRSKSEAEKQAIEGYRLGRQNLLMGQGSSANKSAESLSGSINTMTTDWAGSPGMPGSPDVVGSETLKQGKSITALTDVTGTLLNNVQTVVKAAGYSGSSVKDETGVDEAFQAVDDTLGTWSFDKYMETLNTLTGHSSNKSTWDQMLLDQASAPENPYGSISSAITPLTPIAGTQSNLLAAAAGAASPDVYSMNLSGNKSKAGRLI